VSYCDFLFTEEQYDEYVEFVRCRFAYSGITDMDIMHCIVGLVGEYFEIQLALRELAECNDPNECEVLQDKLEKEYGDFLYYFQASFNILNVTYTQLVYDLDDGPGITYDSWEHGFDEFLDQIKKHHFYKQGGTHIARTLITLWKHITFDWVEQTDDGDYIQRLIEKNKAKLTKRYPKGKFDTEDSIRKADNLG